jgi:SP family sugar porter-like MFS transporter
MKRYLYFITFISAMGGLLFGYDYVVVGGAKIFYEPYFGITGSAALRGWAMSSALVGCLIGSLIAGAWSDRYGRKNMLILAAFLFTVGAYGTGAIHTFTWLVIFRIVCGFGIGIASNISPVYIAEISPAHIRGRFVSLNQLTIVTGILLAQLVNWQIGEHFMPDKNTLTPESVEWAWRWMFWAGMIPAGIFFILTFIIPESPRWLAVNNKREKAEKIFTRIGGASHARHELAEIDNLNTKDEKIQLRVLWKPNVRYLLVIGVVLTVFQQWSGINVIFNYAHEIFTAAGYTVSDVLMNIVVTGITNLIFTFVAIFTVDRWGRKPLMYVGSAGLAAIYAVLGACFFFQVSGWPMLVLVVMAIACFAMSLGPIVWVILSEIFPVKIRSAAMAVATFSLWAACFVLTYTFPLLNKNLGASGAFWLYGGICVAGFFFDRSHITETKGKSLEGIEKELAG